MGEDERLKKVLKKTDRRQGQDPLIKALTAIVMVSFSMVFLIFILILMPKTSEQIMFFRKYNIHPDMPWEESFITYAFVLLIIQLLISSIGIVINIVRAKRRNDKFHYSLLVFTIISLIGIIGITISRG